MFRLSLPILAATLSMLALSCSHASKNQAVIYAAGDKATVGSLVYNVTDAERTQQLGDDPANPRLAKDRFYLIRVSVSNSAADEAPIPAMTLVDDSGQNYPELADGNGVPNWLGIVRKVGPAQTETGYVAFDAPTKHYRMRLTDPFDDKEIAIDIPVNFVRDAGRVEPTEHAPADTGIPVDALPKK